MKVNVEVTCTPEEARLFFGLPDIKPMQDRIMAEIEERLRSSLGAMNPETIFPQFGHYANHDFAGYHIAVNADVEELDAVWIDEEDFHVNAMGAKGIGEVGITGTAAAIANAVHHATGVRMRQVPVLPHRLRAALKHAESR